MCLKYISLPPFFFFNRFSVYCQIQSLRLSHAREGLNLQILSSLRTSDASLKYAFINKQFIEISI